MILAVYPNPTNPRCDLRYHSPFVNCYGGGLLSTLIAWCLNLLTLFCPGSLAFTMANPIKIARLLSTLAEIRPTIATPPPLEYISFPLRSLANPISMIIYIYSLFFFLFGGKSNPLFWLFAALADSISCRSPWHASLPVLSGVLSLIPSPQEACALA